MTAAIDPTAAKVLLRRGNAVEAERVLRVFLAANPRHGGAHLDLGLALMLQKRMAEAQNAFETALAITPDQPMALEALAKIYGDTGRPTQALQCIERLIALRPNSPVAHIHHALRGEALMQLGRDDDAVQAFEAALARRADLARAWQMLGLVHGKRGHPERAHECFERLCVLRPNFAPAHHFRAMALTELYRYEEAVAEFQQALRLDPNFLPALLGQAEPLSTLGRHQDALASYQRALIINPNNAQAELGRGDILQILGRLDEAAAAYDRAITLSPDTPAPYRHRFQVRPATDPDDPALKALEAMLANESKRSEDDTIELHLALSKAYRDLKLPGPAFEHLQEGNRRKRHKIAYDEAAELTKLHTVADQITPEVLQASAGLGDPSKRAIFVLGMPRSGTSLVEQILASHTDVFGAGECGVLRRLATDRFGHDMQIPAGGLSGDTLRHLGADYVAAMAQMAPDAGRIVDKTLNNIAYAGLIHLMLPNARIVHVVRDPMDTCFSCYSQLFLGMAPFAHDLSELGRYYKAYIAVMAHWHDVLPQECLIEVRYEALVADFETEARRLFAFCGLDWQDGPLRFYETKRAVRTASAAQVRQPLYKDAVGRWKAFAPWLTPLREALGIPDSNKLQNGAP